MDLLVCVCVALHLYPAIVEVSDSGSYNFK